MPVRRLTRLLTGLAATSLLLAVSIAPPTAGAATRPVVITGRVAGHGTVLETARGFALYTYAGDTRDHSTCTSTCASAWPPLTLKKGARLSGEKVKGLSLFTRPGGARQVAWRGHPLYRYVGDHTAHEVTGDNVGGFHVAALSSASSSSVTTTTAGPGW